MHMQLTPIVHNSVTLNSLHPSIEAEASSQISLLQYTMVFKCFSLCVFSSRLPFPWAQQPGGAAVQHPSPRTLQQGVQQQQLQWVREQLGVWLREREQLQREWRQQALTLLQPRGKGSHSLSFGMAICYYIHSDLFSRSGAWEEMHGTKMDAKSTGVLLLAPYETKVVGDAGTD